MTLKYPLVGLSIAFCLGIMAAVRVRFSAPVLYLLAFASLMFSIAFLKQEVKFSILILGTSFFLGAAVLRNSQVVSNCHIVRSFPYKSDPASSVIGVIDSYPASRNGRASFILEVEKLKINDSWIKTSGKVLVRVFPVEGGAAGKNDFTYGDRLLLSGNLYRPFSFSKAFNYRDYLRYKSVYFVLSVKKRNMVKHLGKNAGNPLKSFALGVRQKMREVITKNLSFFSAGILNAIILGERQNLPAHVRDVLAKTGTVHIIAISGLHLGIAAFIVLLTLKMLKIPRRPRYIIAIFLLIIYCLMTGAKTPVIRATVMAAILLFGYFLKRETHIYNSLSLALLIILMISPRQLFEVDFQLSFSSVISIIWLSPMIKSFFPEKSDKIPWARFLISAFSVSFAAWLGLLPLVANYFRIFAPITILANTIIVPYMTIIVASGFSLGLIGMLAPSLVPVFAASNELFILILFKVNSLLITIPGAYLKLPRLPLVYVPFYYALLILLLGRKRLIKDFFFSRKRLT